MGIQNKTKISPVGKPGEIKGGEPGKKQMQKDYTALEWFSQQGGHFVRVAGWDEKVPSPGKQPIDKGWQQKPMTLKEIIPHIRAGGNVGLLCGKPSNDLCMLDVDDHLQDFLEYFPGLADAPIVVRPEAPDRGKIILHLTGEIPPNKKWHDHHLEFLGTGNQGVIPPSIHPGGVAYELQNADRPALEYDGARILRVGQDWADRESEEMDIASAPKDGRGRLSRQTRDFIQYGAGPDTRNNRLFIAACDLNGCGYSQAEAELHLLSVWAEMSKSEKEAVATIKSAYSQKRYPANPSCLRWSYRAEGSAGRDHRRAESYH